MPEMDTSRVSRLDGDGGEHTVRVRHTGPRRVIECGTCGWRKPAQFLPWLKAEEHLAQAHDATVDPTPGQPGRPGQPGQTSQPGGPGGAGGAGRDR